MGHSPAEELHPILIKLLAAHGVASRADGPWIIFTNSSAKINGLIHDLDNLDPKCSTQVDIWFSPWPGCAICESFAGVGETREERVRHALDIFSRNTLHVLLHVFSDVRCHDRVHEWNLMNTGVKRAVVDGNLCICAMPIDKPSASEAKSDLPRANSAFFESLEQFLSDHPIPTGTHWVRLFYAQIDSQPVELELLLDNEHWTNAIPAAKQLLFPKTDGYLSVRLFILIQGGFDVGRGVAMIAQHPEAEDEELARLLSAEGISLIDAYRIIILVPVAFAKVSLARSGIEVPTVCTIVGDKGQSSIDLQTSPIFQQATKIAEAAFRAQTMTQAEFLNVAARDASFKGVNQLIKEGSKPENLRCGTSTISWSETASLCGPPDSTFTMPPSRTNVGKSPWWKFW